MKEAPLSKIAAPVLPTAVLHREALTTRLRDIVVAKRLPTKAGSPNYKLVLLCAPAGYGKTTLLADFAQQIAISCCWYFLDASDTDRFTFLNTLLASLRSRFPHFGLELDSLFQRNAVASNDIDDTHYFKAFLDALISALHTEIVEPFVLLLCSYQEVDGNPAITHIVNQLVRQLPSRCLLIIESRATPSIDFASPLARHEAIGWGSHVLRVNAQEIQDLARIQGVAPLSTTEAEQLATLFDGWIAGILLGTRLGDTELFRASTRTGILQGLPSMRIEREKLFAYLVDEIFSRQPARYAFLKEAAVLEHMTPAFCNELLTITSATEQLEPLARQGMFVTCSDDGPHPIYICHPVLRELLCDELHRTAPARFSELHRRAAQLFGDAHEYEKAISHALAAGDSDSAAQFIIQAHQKISSRQHAETFLRWVNTLPSEIREQYPQLLLIQASIHLMRNNYTQALPLLDKASALQTTDSLTVIDPTDLPHLQVELIVLRSKALFQEGRYQEAQLLCQQVLEIIPMDEAALRAEAYMYLGMCSSLLGNPTSGVEHLQKALLLWGRNTIRFQAAEVHGALGNTYTLMGHFALSEHHLSRAFSCWEQLGDEKGKTSILLRMGINKQHQGMFVEAAAALTQALTMARGRTGLQREEGYALLNLGTVYQNQEYYDQSLQVLEQALDLARELKDNYLINLGLCYLAMTYLLMGDASTALLLLSETHLPPQHSNHIAYEQAIHDLIYSTILVHQHRYDEGFPFLTTLENSLIAANIKRELLPVKLYLAACQLARQKQAEAIHYLQEVASLSESQDHGQFVLMELGRLPELHQFVKTSPALERLHTLLGLEIIEQQTKKALPATSFKVANRSQSKLRIQAFGEPIVFLDERPVTRWRMARSMELFFYLLDSGRPMRKEQIITALWPEVDEQINQTFHSTIHYLRKALNDEYIVSRSGIYSIDLSSLSEDTVQYDVAMFKQQYTQAKQLLENEDDVAAKEAFLSMVQLYQGDYVQPFYSDWCTFQRDELRRNYLEARNHLAFIFWRQEEFDASALHWQHMLAIDNCLEEAHYGLIKYYMRTGKRGSALRQYQRCVETLQQELGARPGVAIQSLYQRLSGSSEAIKKSGRTAPLKE